MLHLMWKIIIRMLFILSYADTIPGEMKMNRTTEPSVLSSTPLVLASSSPRRKELLAGLGLSFTVRAAEVDESFDPALPPERVVELLAERKAKTVAEQLREGLVIGSDTIVVLADNILGKPVDETDALGMLRRLQGRAHFVYSGVCVIDARTGKRRIGHRKTEVKMKRLNDEQIRRYIATGEPLDKAGAYAIQGIGATLIEGIKGDYFNVVGLPLSLLADLLDQFGISVL
ncbi:Maf family protein [Bacillaceae bacterium]